MQPKSPNLPQRPSSKPFHHLLRRRNWVPQSASVYTAISPVSLFCTSMVAHCSLCATHRRGHDSAETSSLSIFSPGTVLAYRYKLCLLFESADRASQPYNEITEAPVLVNLTTGSTVMQNSPGLPVQGKIYFYRMPLGPV